MPDDIQLPRPRCTYADHSYPAYDARQVREIVRADRERQQWQPIETAPEGVMLLLADMTAQEARHWAYVDWLVAGKCCSNRHHTPTHWMPLPAAPAAAQRPKEPT